MTPGLREEWQSARIVAGALWRGWWRALQRRDGTARVIWPHLVEAWRAVFGVWSSEFGVWWRRWTNA